MPDHLLNRPKINVAFDERHPVDDDVLYGFRLERQSVKERSTDLLAVLMLASGFRGAG
jgi:hypothetical protein